MRIKIRLNYLDLEYIEVECKGTGTKNDPLLIDSFSNFPKHFDIMKSEHYIIIRNCKFDTLALYYCRNITIENCKIINFAMEHCYDIQITNIDIESLVIINSIKILLENSLFHGNLFLYKSTENTIKNCIIPYISNEENRSRGNILINNNILQISPEEIKILTEKVIEENNTFTIRCGDLLHEIECKGKGTKENPFIIEEIDFVIDDFSRRGILRIYNNRDYVTFNNVSLSNIELFDSQHIKFENCSFSNNFILRNCSDIDIRNNNIKSLIFDFCEEIMIDDSEIYKIKIYRGFKDKISLRNCNLKKIKDKVLYLIRNVD